MFSEKPSNPCFSLCFNGKGPFCKKSQNYRGFSRKIPFLFPFLFPLFFPPARRRRRPVCFPGRRRHVPADASAWIRSPMPCPALSLSYPLALFSLPLRTQKRPKRHRRRDPSPPALRSSPRRSEATTSTAVFSSSPTPSPPN